MSSGTNFLALWCATQADEYHDWEEHEMSMYYGRYRDIDLVEWVVRVLANGDNDSADVLDAIVKQRAKTTPAPDTSADALASAEEIAAIKRREDA